MGNSLRIYHRKQKSRFRRIIELIFRRIELFGILNRLLFLLLKRSNYNQPLYNFAFLKNKHPQRVCIDRADTIYQEIKTLGKGGHILNIGCGIGYYAYYFADRGYLVNGIDNDPHAISICKLLQRINGKKKKVNFSISEFSKEFLEKIPDEQYDIVFLFGVLHHIIYKKGLNYTQELLSQLLKKTSLLYIELPVKNELTDAPWREDFPDDEMILFSQCMEVEIEKVNYFLNHQNYVGRPLYVIKKKQTQMQLCNQTYPVYGRTFTAHQVGYYRRYYYDCGELYIKKYLLFEGTRNDSGKILKEINNYQLLPKNDFFPNMLCYQNQKTSIEILFNKIPGKTLHELLLKGQPIPELQVFVGIVEALAFLFQQGLYHNDIRLWNVMFDGKKTYMIDLEYASKDEKENTNIALLWIIDQLHRFNSYHFRYPIRISPAFDSNTLKPPFRKLVDVLQTTQSFEKFLLWFKTAPLFVTATH